MNIAEIGLIVFGNFKLIDFRSNKIQAIVRGGLEKMDIQVMAPYVANNEQINEAGGAAIVARNDPSGGGIVIVNIFKKLVETSLNRNRRHQAATGKCNHCGNIKCRRNVTHNDVKFLPF